MRQTVFVFSLLFSLSLASVADAAKFDPSTVSAQDIRAYDYDIQVGRQERDMSFVGHPNAGTRAKDGRSASSLYSRHDELVARMLTNAAKRENLEQKLNTEKTAKADSLRNKKAE